MLIKNKLFSNAIVFSAAFIMGVSLQTNAKSVDTVLAIVNGNPITQTNYDRYLATRPQSAKKDRNTIIEELIRRELVLQDAIKNGVDKQPDVIDELTTLRENLLVAANLKAVADKISVTDKELRKFYTEHLNELSVTEYKARHILVSTSEEAKAIIAELDKGADFVELAKKKSKDNSIDGGDLGWFNSAQMVKPFANAVKNLEKGKYTAQPVKTKFGWHVILNEDTRKTPPPPFEKVEDRIKIALQRVKLQEYIQHLSAQAKVEIKN
jgi:peptidyl-prolyl cis-trans isomerase C